MYDIIDMLRYERVYLLYKVADTPFHIRGDELWCINLTALYIINMIIIIIII